MLGIFDQNAVDAAASVNELSQAMADGTIDIYGYIGALKKIPTNIATTLTYTTISSGGGPGPAFNPGGTAGGGWVHGPGDGSRDTFLQPMANNEFVVNARDAKKNAALLEAINNGQSIDAQAANYFYGNVTFVGSDGGSAFMEQR